MNNIAGLLLLVLGLVLSGGFLTSLIPFDNVYPASDLWFYFLASIAAFIASILVIKHSKRSCVVAISELIVVSVYPLIMAYKEKQDILQRYGNSPLDPTFVDLITKRVGSLTYLLIFIILVFLVGACRKFWFKT